MDEAVNILKKGIAIEKNGIEAYLDFAAKVKNETGKNVFIRLAHDEFDHMTVLERQLEGLICNKIWICEAIPKSIIEGLSPRLREIDKIKSGDGIEDLDVLKIGLDLERRSIEFYQNDKKKIEDKEAVKMFDRIIEMEESHYDLLQAEIDHIEKTGFWFGIREFTLESERG